MTGYPIVAPGLVCPMPGNPCPVTGGRKFPVGGAFYISAVSFGPFSAYPYMMRGGRLGFVHDGGTWGYLDINVLG